MTEKGILLILSGPSGCGKSTVLKKVMSGRNDIQFSVSATTRAPRDGETDGKDYFFVSRQRFSEMVENGELLEHAEFVGNCYGTPKKAVLDKLSAGINVVLDIEVQGASQVKHLMPEAISVFLAPPSIEALEARLRGRGTEDEATIQSRLKTAQAELMLAETYDYIVINDAVDNAAEKINQILSSKN